MANIKDLKKEIRYLCEDIITDALEVAEMVDKKGKQKALKLINEIAVFHNEMVQRANNPENEKDPKQVKNHYAKLRKDFTAGLKKFYDKLYKLVPETPTPAAKGKDDAEPEEEKQPSS
ncbi:MAG: hypothetical protein K9H26_02895 [Prolixibacteraceae bacterium]|nr:hypothetical protein [Prolixibacteraceae bacterium]